MKQKPEASVRRKEGKITYRGETTYSNIYRTVTISDKKYIPTRKPVINCVNKHPWERVPSYIQDQYDYQLADKFVNSFGMNTNDPGFLKDKS